MVVIAEHCCCSHRLSNEWAIWFIWSIAILCAMPALIGSNVKVSTSFLFSLSLNIYIYTDEPDSNEYLRMYLYAT